MIVKVTKKNIKEAASPSAPCLDRYCPIAKALRPLSRRQKVSVGEWMITIGNKTWDTPDEAAQFINAYDEGLAVKPFTFELGEPTN